MDLCPGRWEERTDMVGVRVRISSECIQQLLPISFLYLSVMAVQFITN